ncbi:transglutaminase-like domain-containing protein, partial [Patescibacteria group bacterium]|nr:transglutaminase-like domain-containing protein [Patescibacteria group bacterium]
SAMARAAGIPSRELDGYAYSANTKLRPLSLTKDVLHSWPEFWDDARGWVMVDPTWENTTGGVDYFNKLDLNHFVFAIKGSSSSEPIPAGSYKYSGVDSNDVKVSLAENDFLGKPQIDVQINAPDTIFAGFPNVVRVKISNTGNALYTSALLGINASQLSILNGGNQNIGLIPAFGSAEFNFNTRTKSLFDSYADQITVLVGGQKFTRDVVIKPFLLFQTIPLLIGAVIGLMILVYLSVLGAHVYFSKKKKRIVESAKEEKPPVSSKKAKKKVGK